VFNLAELSSCALFSGRLPLATQLADEAARVARELGPSAIAVASERRSLVPFASGDLAAARTSIEEALSMWLEQGSAWHIAWMRVMRAAVTLVAGDAEVAQAMADDAVEVSRASGMRWQLGQALLWRARVALARGHAEEGETLAHEALQVMQRFGDRLGLAMTLETLAAAAVSGESFAEAIRLCAAANRIRGDNGLVRLPIDEPGFQSTIATARAALGPESSDTAWAEGIALRIDEAIAYAVRGRGERKRPSSGWASLTPVELDVVRAVTAGLSNPEIASKLFVSRNTVKIHLAHIFTKLGVTTRAELAATAARRDL
ncbi:MAG: response regulator transcription factor, partial [Acidimicrobiales bacterium]